MFPLPIPLYIILTVLALVAVERPVANPSPTFEFSESATTTGIFSVGGVIAYAIRGRTVSREEFRTWLKVQDPKAQWQFCPFFPEFCGEPI